MQSWRTIFVDTVHIWIGYFVSLFRLDKTDELTHYVRLTASAGQV